MILIRHWRDEEAGELALIFHRAVQEGAASVYSQPQRDDWSPRCPSAEGWRDRLRGLSTLVAKEEDGGVLAFMSINLADGELDLAFTLPEHARRGTGRVLYRATEAEARAAGLTRLTAEASALSEGLFLSQGWHRTGTRDRGEGEARITTTLMAKDL